MTDEELKELANLKTMIIQVRAQASAMPQFPSEAVRHLLDATEFLLQGYVKASDELTRLRQEIEDAPVVVCRNDSGKWACDEHTGFARASHSGRLVRIEKIEGKE